MGAFTTSGPLGPIQVIPPGLMGLLQLKQTGRLPGQLSDTVVPTVEMRDWYLTARRVDHIALFPAGAPIRNGVVTGTLGALALLSGGQSAQVPDEQIWWVEEFAVLATTDAAASSVRYCAAHFNKASTAYFPVGVEPQPSSGRLQVLVSLTYRGFWAFPGDTFGMVITDLLSAGGINFQGHLRATVCPI